MALEYGFGRWAQDPAESAFWTEKYQALSAIDKGFYDQLGTLMLITNIGVINEATIPQLINRINLIDRNMVTGFKSTDEFAKYLKRFIGYRANVLTLDTTGWIRKRAKEMRYRLGNDFSGKKFPRLDRPDEELLARLPADKLPLFVNHNWQPEAIRLMYQDRLAKGV
jgi:hypothetical protein